MTTTNLILFVAAAAIIAVSPGPGLFYVAARTLAGGRREGLASSFGTGIGGMVHVLAASLGLSAVVMASADAFTVLKLAGAAYLVLLGIKTFRQAGATSPADLPAGGVGRAFREGIVVEASNPKTAIFFLAFLPQFVDPAGGSVALQLALLGATSVALNTLADVVIVMMASFIRRRLIGRTSIVRRLRQGSGLFLCGLGAALALSRRTA